MAFARTWAMELARAELTVNAIVPTAWTAMTATIPIYAPLVGRDEFPPEVRREHALGMPEDCAPLVVFLASDAARGRHRAGDRHRRRPALALLAPGRGRARAARRRLDGGRDRHGRGVVRRAALRRPPAGAGPVVKAMAAYAQTVRCGRRISGSSSSARWTVPRRRASVVPRTISSVGAHRVPARGGLDRLEERVGAVHEPRVGEDHDRGVQEVREPRRGGAERLGRARQHARRCAGPAGASSSARFARASSGRPSRLTASARIAQPAATVSRQPVAAADAADAAAHRDSGRAPRRRRPRRPAAVRGRGSRRRCRGRGRSGRRRRGRPRRRRRPRRRPPRTAG